MKHSFLALCCLLLWACNGKQCGKQSAATDTAADSLNTKEQWQGVIHAVTCQDIEVQLTFTRAPGAGNGAYRMTQHCKDNDNTFTDEGTWHVKKGKDLVYVLQSKEDGALHSYRINGNRLVELDADQKEVDSYYLEKVE
jgi:hypothetical protein